LFSRSQQFVTLACPLGGQQRVPTRNQALARVIRMLDLGQITLIEER
jgi:hypothetical protein